jgi:anti-sigma B factor antagonist
MVFLPKGAFVGDVNTPGAGEPLESSSDSTRSDTITADLDSSEPGSVHVIVGTTRARIVLSGEIDADLVADLHQATSDVEEAGLPVEIDAHHVTFMDSTGVAFLARLTAVSPERVRILRTPPTVKFLLEVTSIGDMLDIVDDEADDHSGLETGAVPVVRPAPEG